jgi:hypothetical protein
MSKCQIEQKRQIILQKCEFNSSSDNNGSGGVAVTAAVVVV